MAMDDDVIWEIRTHNRRFNVPARCSFENIHEIVVEILRTLCNIFRFLRFQPQQEKFEQAAVSQVHAAPDLRSAPFSQFAGQEPAYVMTNTQLNTYEPDNVVEAVPPVFSG